MPARFRAGTSGNVVLISCKFVGYFVSKLGICMRDAHEGLRNGWELQTTIPKNKIENKKRSINSIIFVLKKKKQAKIDKKKIKIKNIKIINSI